jgi:methylated-DNA-[protein]-cysteine S-methyltransferase
VTRGSTRWWRQATPHGAVLLECVDGAVVRVVLPGADAPAPPGRSSRDPAIARRLDAYFAGGDDLGGVPVDLTGSGLSELQQQILLMVRAEVPYGETATYGEVAELVGRPGAARAVGTAMARCPVPLFVPCHRVVAANGIGGYGGGPAGVALKRALLDRERRARFPG